MEFQLKNIVIDSSYIPKIGDILSNSDHPLITIEHIYSLNKNSTRVNRNYYDQLAKYELLKSVIQKREIIWDQHKFDFRLFPENDPQKHTDGVKRNDTSYLTYLFYNDPERYKRLFCSKYRNIPQRKITVSTGKKIMVTANHSLCVHNVNVVNQDQSITVRRVPCNHWYGKRATPLTYLVNKQFIYHGNIFYDVLNIDIPK